MEHDFLCFSTLAEGPQGTDVAWVGSAQFLPHGRSGRQSTGCLGCGLGRARDDAAENMDVVRAAHSAETVSWEAEEGSHRCSWAGPLGEGV